VDTDYESTSSAPAGLAPFEVLVTENVDGCRIEVRGELDLTTVPTLDLALTRARLSGIASTVIVDLRWLTRTCSAGIGLLLTHHYALRAAGSRLIVMSPPQQLLELLLYNRLEGILDLRDSAALPPQVSTGCDIPTAL
jgi:anti-anti-sigma factor